MGHPCEFSHQFTSVTQSCLTLCNPWTIACQASLYITNSQSLLKLMSIESVIPSNHLFLYCPLLLLPSIFPSIRVFSSESVLCIRWPKYWSFSFSSSPSNEYSGLIAFRMDWLDLLAVQGTLKSLLQHHSSEASVLQRWTVDPGELWFWNFLGILGGEGPSVPLGYAWVLDDQRLITTTPILLECTASPAPDYRAAVFIFEPKIKFSALGVRPCRRLTLWKEKAKW